MVAVPALTPVADPYEPDELPTLATAVFVEVQCELIVMSCVLESSNTPVAVNRVCPPIGMVVTEGTREMETILADVTVNGTESVTEPREAVIVTKPAARPATNPLLAPMLMTVGSETDQFA